MITLSCEMTFTVAPSVISSCALSALAFQSSPSMATRPLFSIYEMRSVTMASRPSRASMPLFLPLLPFLKLLSNSGLTAMKARNVATENHNSCPSMPDEQQLATAAAAEPTAKHIITKPDVKIPGLF